MNAADGRRRTLVRPDTYVSLPRSSVVAVILDGSTVSGLAWPAVDRAFERKGVKLNGGGPAPPLGVGSASAGLAAGHILLDALE